MERLGASTQHYQPCPPNHSSTTQTHTFAGLGGGVYLREDPLVSGHSVITEGHWHSRNTFGEPSGVLILCYWKQDWYLIFCHMLPVNGFSSDLPWASASQGDATRLAFHNTDSISVMRWLSTLSRSSFSVPVTTDLQAGKPILLLSLSHKISLLGEGLFLSNNAHSLYSFLMSL